MRSDKYGAAIRRRELQVSASGRDRAMGNRPQTVGHAVSAREYGCDAGHRPCFTGVHFQDPCVGMQRADHGRMELTGQVEIIAESSPAGEEPGILPAGHGSPDGAKRSIIESSRHRTLLTGVSGSIPERLRSHVAAPFSLQRPATAFRAKTSQASVHSPMA